jgi:hypothetical protein
LGNCSYSPCWYMCSVSWHFKCSPKIFFGAASERRRIEKKKRGPAQNLSLVELSQKSRCYRFGLLLYKRETRQQHHGRKEQPSQHLLRIVSAIEANAQLKNHTDPQIKFKIYFSPCPIMAIYGGICRLDIKKQVGTPARPKFMLRHL